MPKAEPVKPAAAQGDEQIIELIFDNSALPVGRVIHRLETFAELGYEFLDFVELCMELEDRYHVDLDELCDADKFGAMRVEEIVQAVKRVRPVVYAAATGSVDTGLSDEVRFWPVAGAEEPK